MTTSVVLQRSLNTLTSNEIHQLPLIISLEGKLPPHLIDTTIPLRLSLSLPEPYNLFLKPRISEELTHEQEFVVAPTLSDSDIFATVPYPSFLPLRPTFNHQSTQSWVELHKSIAWWMSTFVEQRHHSQGWEWGREAYWMAFAAAYTDFLNTNWPTWDTTIELEGPFIQSWFYSEQKSTDDDGVEDSEDGSEDSEGSDKCTQDRDHKVRENVWQRFHMHVWSAYSVFI